MLLYLNYIVDCSSVSTVKFYQLRFSAMSITFTWKATNSLCVWLMVDFLLSKQRRAFTWTVTIYNAFALATAFTLTINNGSCLMSLTCLPFLGHSVHYLCVFFQTSAFHLSTVDTHQPISVKRNIGRQGRGRGVTRQILECLERTLSFIHY